VNVVIPYEFIVTPATLAHKRRNLAVLLFTCCVLWQMTTTAGAEDNRHVLVFYEQGRSSAAVTLIDYEIREVLEEQTTYHIDLYVEYMETNLFIDPVSQQKIREWYLQKYRNYQPDVIIAAGNTPIHFIIHAHQKSFPGVPIIICGTTENWTNRTKLDSLSTIVLNRQPALMEEYGRYVFGGLLLLFAQLLLILQLLRQRAKERVIRRHLRESEARLREAQSIAQCGSWEWDLTENKTYWSDEMYRILGLVPQSVAPTSSLIYQASDHDYVAKMKQAADTQQTYLAEHRIVRPNGEERIVLETGHPKYDSLQGSVSMVGTLLDITDQRRAERVLRESEERFRSMADGAPIMMWMSGVDKLCTDANRGWLMFTGHSIEQELGNGWIEGVHPDDLQRCMSTYAEAFDKRMPFSMEYRLRRYDGEYHWINDTGSPRFLPDGTFAGYIGCSVDIHDRKAVELARLDLARRLMIAQEKERTRVARELHDGIGQEIALLGIKMQRAAASTSTEPGQIYPAIQKLCTNLTTIGLHVGRLSHQLHSSELEYLGLSVAIAKLCREVSEQYTIKIACTCTNIPANLDNDVALGFLRVVQESLHNIAKHSNAKDVEIVMTGATEELSLVVRDNGVGFDLRALKAAAGLGLISMGERMQLIGGEFEIKSTPGVGTTIRARVPLPTTKPNG